MSDEDEWRWNRWPLLLIAILAAIKLSPTSVGAVVGTARPGVAGD